METMAKGFKAFAYCILGEYEKSVEAMRSVNSPQRMNINLSYIEALSLHRLGRYEESQHLIALAMTKFPNLTVSNLSKGNRNFAPSMMSPLIEGLREMGVPEE